MRLLQKNLLLYKDSWDNADWQNADITFNFGSYTHLYCATSSKKSVLNHNFWGICGELTTGKIRACYSENGTHWTPTSSNHIIETASNWKDIATDGTTLVVIGENSSGKPVISKSTNGQSWDSDGGYLKVVSAWGSIVPNSIQYCNGIFLVAMGDKVSTSTDGWNWSSMTTCSDLSNKLYRHLCLGRDCFMVIGKDNSILTSTNGTDWETVGTAPTISQNPQTSDWLSIVFDGTKYIAVGIDKKYSISFDLEHWSPIVQKNDLISDSTSLFKFGGNQILLVCNKCTSVSYLTI